MYDYNVPRIWTKTLIKQLRDIRTNWVLVNSPLHQLRSKTLSTSMFISFNCHSSHTFSTPTCPTLHCWMFSNMFITIILSRKLADSCHNNGGNFTHLDKTNLRIKWADSRVGKCWWLVKHKNVHYKFENCAHLPYKSDVLPVVIVRS
jgi:hypothetical protein